VNALATGLKDAGRPAVPRPAEGSATRLTGAGGFDFVLIGALALGLVLVFAPTLWDLTDGAYSGLSQGHETMVLLVAAWLLWRKRAALAALPSAPSARTGGVLVGVALLVYSLARSQEWARIELLGLIALVPALLAVFKGTAAWRIAWFPVAFMLFAVPLPYELLLAVTGPLKAAVSAAACQVLLWFGYPIGRSGVVITIGQYQLLVTEACAGLQSIFTLEAVGLVYASLMDRRHWVRQALLAVMVIPASFTANVIRVMALVLVTHYLGDAAGRGFLHGFAGIVLFGVALVLIYFIDVVIGRLLPARYAS